MHQGWVSKICASMAAALVCASAGNGVGRGAPARAYTAITVTQNLCSAACHTGDDNDRGDYRGRTYLEQSVTNIGGGVWMVAAQEVCWNDFFHMADYFSGLSAAWFVTDPTHGGCPSSGPYGDALFTIGPNIGPPEKYTFTASTYSPAVIPDEARATGCQAKQGFGFTWSGCVVHAVNSLHGDPGAQAAQARYFTGPRQPRLIVDGDFNNSSASVPSSWPYAWEADGSLAWTALMADKTDLPTKKIDWSFADSSWFPSGLGATSCGTIASIRATATYTDHCLLRGNFST